MQYTSLPNPQPKSYLDNYPSNDLNGNKADYMPSDALNIKDETVIQDEKSPKHQMHAVDARRTPEAMQQYDKVDFSFNSLED